MSYLGKVDMNDANIKHYSLTGSTLTTVNIGWTPASEQSLRVTINGVVQQGDTFSYSGANLTLGGPLIVTDTLEVVGIQSVGNIITPADNSVTTAKLADDAVTLAKMAGGTDGNLITYDASGNPAYVATGSATNILTSNGAGAAPTFQAAAAGFDSIALLSTQTASASASVNFDNTLLTSDYRTYEVRFMNVVGATDSVSLEMQFSDDNGSNFDSNHTNNMAAGYAGSGGSALSNDATNDSVGADYARLGKDQSFDAEDSMGGTVTIQNPSSTSFITTYQAWSSHITFNAANVYAYSIQIGGYWDSVAAVNYIRFRMSSGNIATGTFQLWGYK